MHKFVKNIVAFSLRNHIFVLFMTFLLVVAGIIATFNTPIEAYPDVTSTRVRVITQWPGRSAEEVEKFITLPVMRELNTIPRKTKVRSTSLFGLSVVTVLFEEGVDDFYAQTFAAMRIMGLELPEDAESEIEPPSGATGEIFRYVIRSDRHIREITAIDEWVIQRELLSVPGVADVVSFGGEEKIYEIRLNPVLLNSYGISALDVLEAVESSNVNVGGDMIQKGSQAFAVRGIGLLQSIEDIEHILIDVRGGVPVRVGHVAEVVVSSMPRLGQVGLNDDYDVVQGIIVMLRGENPSEVIRRIHAKIYELNNFILPPDVRVEPFIDRTILVETTIRTVARNMLEGIFLVTCVLFLFLFNWRVTLITVLVIPIAFLFTVIMLRIQGLPANLISMGALNFGLLLEGTLVIVERVFVMLGKKNKSLGFNEERFSNVIKTGTIRSSASNVAPAIFFAQLTTVVALIPIFAFQQVEGKMFSPLAFTLGYAILGSLILALTFVPVMCKVLLTKPIRERDNVVSRSLIQSVIWIYEVCARRKRAVIVASSAVLVACVIGFMNHGTEFIPRINEGAIYVRATLPNSVSLEESVRLTREMKSKLREFEEVDFILSQTGRPNDGTDPTGFFNIEFHIELKPRSEWTRRVRQDDLVAEMQQVLEAYPGIYFGFSQPIQDNVEEYVSGVKSSLVVNVFGRDLFQMESVADEIAYAIRDIRGIEDVNVFRSVGLPELQIRLNQTRMARHGVLMEDAQAVIEMAIGGTTATTFFEDERMFDVRLRFAEEHRSDEIAIGNILVPTLEEGVQVPLREIADIEFVTGPAFIYREGNSRFVAVGFSVRGRDMGGAIAEAQARVREVVEISPENRIVWAGEFENMERAMRRLSVVVPMALLLILFLLYMNFGNVRDTLITAGTAFPFAFIGGYLSLLATGTVFGISAGVGFTILFGVTVTDSLLLVENIKEKLRTTRNLTSAITAGVRDRARPILMIALLGSVGLLPAALSTGLGSEIQKPIAIMVVGGMIIAMVLTFAVLPQVFYFAYRKKYKA
ncbi:MAG: CusA/CzcA family heavy metal efflux RND transporter [Bacteroidales bacterium]|nr:CusA/CzcA family heavy metal efflux RND transporter [Bacteroidales bacterium]